MKVLILSRYGRKGASSRLRMMQYVPGLEASGCEVSVEHLFGDQYLEALYMGQRANGDIFSAYRRRIRSLMKAKDADVIWLEKEALPWVPAAIEHGLFPRDAPLVVDYDDAVFHRYDRHRSAVVRAILGGKIGQVMARADLVIAGNHYLRDYALRAGADRVEVVPTVVDADAYAPTAKRDSDRTVTIGWVGTPGTWQDCVMPFLPDIKAALSGLDARLMAVGAGPLADQLPDLTIRAWSEDREVADIQAMDIGIMPLPDTPWMRGKCGYKLIQYMACGLPVVASPVGVNREIVDHGVNGFLADTPLEWAEALSTLVTDDALRQRMGGQARALVERQYSLRVQGPHIAELLRSACA
ncbi:hypothetical protein BA899_09755 [Spiribacter sp. SSL99]|nr:hypothetical protein BA899_09755 [Spiribacter sp. SSL99]